MDETGNLGFVKIRNLKAMSLIVDLLCSIYCGIFFFGFMTRSYYFTNAF